MLKHTDTVDTVALHVYDLIVHHIQICNMEHMQKNKAISIVDPHYLKQIHEHNIRRINLLSFAVNFVICCSLSLSFAVLGIVRHCCISLSLSLSWMGPVFVFVEFWTLGLHLSLG